VIGHYYVRSVGYEQLAIVLEVATLTQFLFLFQEYRGIHHKAVAHDVQGVRMEYARRNEMNDDLFACHIQGVAGIVAALESDYHVRAIGQEIDDFALAFITPLSSHYNKSAQTFRLS